jgi:hypothetical protein
MDKIWRPGDMYKPSNSHCELADTKDQTHIPVHITSSWKQDRAKAVRLDPMLDTY